MKCFNIFLNIKINAKKIHSEQRITILNKQWTLLIFPFTSDSKMIQHRSCSDTFDMSCIRLYINFDF